MFVSAASILRDFVSSRAQRYNWGFL